MQADTTRIPTYTVSCEDYVHVVEFSPFSSGTPSSLLAYGGNQYVVVGTCLFQEEDLDVEGVEFNVLRAFHHELRVDALAWSPESRLDRLPIIRFCTAAADRKLRLLTSDLQDKHEVKVMEGHASYINHLVFEPTEGKQIASVSDDHTCRSTQFYFHVCVCFPSFWFSVLFSVNGAETPDSVSTVKHDAKHNTIWVTMHKHRAAL